LKETGHLAVQVQLDFEWQEQALMRPGKIAGEKQEKLAEIKEENLVFKRNRLFNKFCLNIFYLIECCNWYIGLLLKIIQVILIL